jgi:predicted nucleotidyltransferase
MSSTRERTGRSAALGGGGSTTSESGLSFDRLVEEPHAHEVPGALLNSVIRYFDPVKVILFGSRARGDARPDSDYDLFIVLDDQVPEHKLRWQAPYEARRSFSGAVDIVRCRRSVYEDRREVIGSLANTATEEGIVVYERPPSA